MNEKNPDALTRRTKILYGSGDFGFSLTDTIIGVIFAIFLTDVAGLQPGYAAAAIFIGRSWDYINDPLIGHLSDRTRTRWGRRRPFLLFGFIPFGIAFMLMWWIPPINTQVGLMFYYALAYLIFDASVTVVSMPYFALTPELTPDYDERTSLTSYRMAFSILGGLIAFTVPLILIGPMRPENADRVMMMGILFGTVSALPVLLTFIGTRERPEYQTRSQPKLLTSLKSALKNRPFIFAAGLFLFTWTGLNIVQTMLLYFLKYRLNLEAESDLVAGTVFVVAFLTLPIWEWASRRWDKRKAYIIGMIFLSIVMLTLIVISPSWGLSVVIFLAALAGIGVAAVHVLPWSIIPDAVEVDELVTGERHEGMYYSLVLLMRKIASSIALPMTLLVLQWSGYVSNAPVQPTSAIRAIQMMIGPVPALCFFAGIIFALVYPLTRESHAEIREEIARVRPLG